MDVRSGLLLALSYLLVTKANALDGEMAELAKMLRENCVEESGVDARLIDEVNGGAELMGDGALKCYMKCVMETAGMLADGVVDVEAVVALLPPELQRHTDGLRGCATQPGVDHCDIAYNTQACWRRVSKQDYILI